MKLAIVVPRYGIEVLGGAERLARGFATAAARRGWNVEVWTTCARNHYTWRNAIPAGSREENGVLVRRFRITTWDPGRRAALELALASRSTLPGDDPYAWLESGPHSAPLYAHAVRHAPGFDAVLALPYASPLVHYAAWALEGRTLLCPCLHDEPYAYMEPVRLLLEEVEGVVFLSPEERDLALHRLRIRPRHQAVMGGGVAVPDELPAREVSPLLLYAGRLEDGKNVPLLYDYVRRYADAGGGVRLMVLGAGPCVPPRHPAFSYCGFVAEGEKRAAQAAALALCQPSRNESFSLALMESWLAGRPVLVHGDCDVTRGHARRSRGGLWFRSYPEFAATVAWLQAHPQQADRMGRNGRRYVLHNYTWDLVLARFERLVHAWGVVDG